MTGPIDGNFGNFRIPFRTTERANEAALVENKPILSFVKSNPIANLGMPTPKQPLDFSGLGLSVNDQNLVAKYVTPDQQVRIGQYISNLV